MKDINSCVHCGSDCGKNPIISLDSKFCCNGCLTVYQIINENKLYKYYNIEQSPGIKVIDESPDNKFAYLENEELQKKIYEFVEGNTVKVNFFIPAIHCASCIWLLENLRTLNHGIKHSIVNFIKKEVSITFDKSEITLRQLVELLRSIHYIPEISFEDNKAKDKESKSGKRLLYKLGIAGFVFLNVMTYSLPEYFGLDPYEENLSILFRILSYILVIPVVFFCADDYFISGFKNLIKKNINIDLPIAIGISVLFIVTSYQVISNTGSGYSDSLAGLIFFLLLGKNIQNRTYQALSFDRDYKSYFPVAVTKEVTGKETNILLSEIRKGDIILIRNKELIPADSVLFDGNALIDYSFVTGESAPVAKKTGDFIYAGGRQAGGIIKVKVEKEVEQSHLTKLWNQSESDETIKKSLKSITDRVSEYFTVAIIGIAIIGFLFWLYFGNFSHALYSFTAVLIIACPCALALSFPFTMGNTMRVLGKAGLYIKNISVIENLTKIDTIVFDKTGTITKPDESNIIFVGNKLSEREIVLIASVTKQSTHPLSNAIYRKYEDYNYIPPIHYTEMPGKGIYANVDNSNIKIGSEQFVTDKADYKQVNKGNDTKASTVYISIDNKICGYFNISNKYREGFEDVIGNLKNRFELYLLSGDNDKERENLLKYFDPNKTFFNQKPQDKKEFIKKLQDSGRNVLMTGDGLNDSGALMQSNVALSVADDIYHFSPAGDAVLDASKFKNLSNFLGFSKISLNIVKISFIISFLYNIVGISFALAGNLSPVIAAILMPLSSISVVAFATLSVRFSGRKL